jgi:signal transduction histidine kinase
MTLPQYAPTKPERTALRSQLECANGVLQKQLEAQKKLTIALERRADRTLTTIQMYLNEIPQLAHSSAWQSQLTAIQAELHQLSDLLADTTLLQKMATGKVTVCLEAIDLKILLAAVSRHLQSPQAGQRSRLCCKIDPALPWAWADGDLTEAVITDLLARAVKYSDLDVPVVLEAVSEQAQIHLRVLAQRFAPAGQGDFAPEIALCCKRIELQQGTITCQLQAELMLVTIALPIAA